MRFLKRREQLFWGNDFTLGSLGVLGSDYYEYKIVSPFDVYLGWEKFYIQYRDILLY